jgi:hypothetical protein
MSVYNSKTVRDLEVSVSDDVEYLGVARQEMGGVPIFTLYLYDNLGDTIDYETGLKGHPFEESGATIRDPTLYQDNGDLMLRCRVNSKDHEEYDGDASVQKYRLHIEEDLEIRTDAMNPADGELVNRDELPAEE